MYHWSPTSRRDTILREGLKPYSEPVTSTVAFAYICLSPTASSSWSLSGDMGWTTDEDNWDLWQVRLSEDDEVHIRPDFGPIIREVRVHNAISADRVWWVAERSPKSGKTIERSQRARASRKKT